MVMLIGSFCTVLNQTILATAFPTLMKAFDISTATVQWLTTGFMMVNGIMIPVSAYLSNKFNSKWLYISAMTIFELGTITAFAAPNFGTLLCGRLIQATGVGITMPLMQNIMLTIFPPEKRGAAMGINGLVIALAPAMGPSLSGWVVDNYSWRVLFGMIIPIVAIVIFASFFLMQNVIKTTDPTLDWLSLLISTVGFGSVLYGFSSVGDKGWTDAIVWGTILIGVILIAILVWRQNRLEHPFLNFKVFKTPEFALATLLSSVVMIAMVGVELVLPLYLQIVHGMSAFHSGLTLLFGAIMMGVMSPITGNLFDRYGARRLAMTGMFILTIGTLPFAFLTRETPILDVVFLYAVRMFGISMVMMPVTTSGMNALPFSMISHGTAVNNTIRQVASSMGSAILISVLTNVTNSQKPAHSLLKSSPLQYKSQMIDVTLNGYHAAFWIAIAFAVIGLLATSRLGNGNKIHAKYDSNAKKGGNA
ncbi:MDR family MFS transporter [Limosilactobacillus mucosae]|uniref:MDR family MFS transporter n=1 Tax=Limosilactobacillus mucosae TaxID=97478 RepID=A0AAJ1M829_LIMMU|nr:MDR family MFS transporter [Limosilactobacillus mucosae]MDC2827351.1 MDR family MFS transporter [Limosilactobacillus mucosae]MDC2834796.1 MDR family MFS transporter [Limosilactobacillus mucosae]MDC2842898.1 MDR family MFS transporter [Limosilactobacillus mucosae]